MSFQDVVEIAPRIIEGAGVGIIVAGADSRERRGAGAVILIRTF